MVFGRFSEGFRRKGPVLKISLISRKNRTTFRTSFECSHHKDTDFLVGNSGELAVKHTGIVYGDFNSLLYSIFGGPSHRKPSFREKGLAHFTGGRHEPEGPEAIAYLPEGFRRVTENI